jgi:hypothetical protein
MMESLFYESKGRQACRILMRMFDGCDSTGT